MPTSPSLDVTVPLSSVPVVDWPSGEVNTTDTEPAPLASHDNVYRVSLIMPVLGPKLIVGAGGGGGASVTETVTTSTTDPFTLNPAPYVPAVSAS